MANSISELAASKIPVLRNADDYPLWKEGLYSYFRFIDHTMITCLEKGNFQPMLLDANGNVTNSINEDPEKYTKEDREKVARDNKTLGCLELALSPALRRSFPKCETALDLWGHIVARFEGNVELKRNKLALLRKQFDRFSWNVNETIKQMVTRFSTLVQEINTQGGNLTTAELNRKFMDALPTSWLTHIHIIQQLPGSDTWSFDQLVNKLEYFELDARSRSD